jgi:hypothetical protein
MQSFKDQTLRDQKEKQTSETIQQWGLKKDGAKYAVPHLSKNWNHTRQDIVLMERIAAIMSSQPGGNGMPVEIKEDFYFVKQDIEDMRNMVKAFNYYHVRLDEEKVLVNEHTRVEGECHD